MKRTNTGKNLVSTAVIRQAPPENALPRITSTIESIMKTAEIVSGMPITAVDPMTVAERNTRAKA